MTRLALLVAVSGVVLLGCKKEGAACPARYADLTEPMKTAGGECSCPAGAGSGSVWGGSLYTTDSSICRAAVHAGAIEAAKGGTVKFMPAAGCPRYTGSEKNGVTTSKWNSYPNSFHFPGHGDAKCSEGVADECPATFLAIPDAANVTTFSCSCAADATGSVWGTDIYTRDSSLCKAAMHAGALAAGTGKITVKPAKACKKYAGSARNNVTSGDWAAYEGGSFTVEGGTPKDCLE